MLIISIANHKGGVGKTATTHALGVLLAERLRVLLCDVDPQGALTGACGVGDMSPTLADVINGAGRVALRSAIRPLEGRLSIVPASIDLAASELGLSARLGRESVLKKALATVGNDYDVCLLDCPPSLGLLTVNALAASDAVLIPAQPTAQDARALASFMASLEAIRAEINPTLHTLGVLLTFYDDRLTHHRAIADELQSAGVDILPMRIKRTVKAQEAAAANQSVVTYATDNDITQAYRELSEVISKWLKQNKQRAM